MSCVATARHAAIERKRAAPGKPLPGGTEHLGVRRLEERQERLVVVGVVDPVFLEREQERLLEDTEITEEGNMLRHEPNGLSPGRAVHEALGIEIEEAINGRVPDVSSLSVSPRHN